MAMIAARSHKSLGRIVAASPVQKRRLAGGRKVKRFLGSGSGPGSGSAPGPGPRGLCPNPVVSGRNQHGGSQRSMGLSVLAGPLWLVLVSLSAVKLWDPREGEADAKASDEEESITEEVCGVAKYAANKPIEDRHFVARLDNGGWWFSVFDGHGGWQCSEYAHKKLHTILQVELFNHLGSPDDKDDEAKEESSVDELYSKHSPEIVERAIKAAFERTDRQYMTKVYGAFELGFGRDTRAGSCALGVFVLDEIMYVANAGDSRAVIGVNRKAVAREDPRSLQKLQQKGVTSEGPTRSTTMEELDEDLEIAALRQSTGEKPDPEAQKRLRQKLLARLFEDSKEDEEREEEQDVYQDESSTNAESEESSDSKGEKSSSSFNPLVNAVTFLTGGQSRRGSHGTSKYIPLEMSHDHNCKHPSERKKLEREHKGEPDIVICKSPNSCYVKGKLQPTRALGDFYLKYSEFMRKSTEDSSAGKYIPPPYTPPYIVATPEVQLRQLVRGRDEFLVIASDGLWDMMSSQEVIEIAGLHLRTKGESVEKVSQILVDEALARAARNNNLTLEKLKSLRPGRMRRSKHDDISVIVVDLTKLLNLHYWG